MDLLDQTSGAHSSFTVNCAGDALSGFSTAEIGFLFFASVTSLQARTTSGLLAPSERDFSAGNWDYSWTTGMLATGQMVMSNSSMGEIDMVFRDAPVQIKWQTAGAGPQAFESVTAPAGTFSEALKVTAKARFDLMIELNLAGEDQLVPAVLELTSSLWYAPHVGLIKQIFASAEVFVGGYSCPVDISSQMELLEYTFPS